MRRGHFSYCCWFSPAPTTFPSQSQVLSQFSHQFVSPEGPSLSLPSYPSKRAAISTHSSSDPVRGCLLWDLPAAAILPVAMSSSLNSSIGSSVGKLTCSAKPWITVGVHGFGCWASVQLSLLSDSNSVLHFRRTLYHCWKRRRRNWRRDQSPWSLPQTPFNTTQRQTTVNSITKQSKKQNSAGFLGSVPWACVSARTCWYSWRSINQSPPETGRRKSEEEKKERTLHPLARCAASVDIVTNLLRGGPVSVGRIVFALCQANTLSTRCCAQTEVILSTFAIPFFTSPFQSVCWLVVPVVWIAHIVREWNERVCRLNFLWGFTSSGYTDVSAAASSGWAFTYRRILHSLNLLKRPESLGVGEGSISKLLAGKVYDHLGFSSVTSAAMGALAPFRKSYVSLPTSAVNAPSVPQICWDEALSNLDGFAQRMLLSTKDHQGRVTREDWANMYCDPLLGHNDRVCSDFACSLV